jgi:hypothetical protein
MHEHTQYYYHTVYIHNVVNVQNYYNARQFSNSVATHDQGVRSLIVVYSKSNRKQTLKKKRTA